jgi:hypothetical protein
MIFLTSYGCRAAPTVEAKRLTTSENVKVEEEGLMATIFGVIV